MKLAITVKFNDDELDAIYKTINILDKLVDEMSEHHLEEVLSKEDFTHHIKQIDEIAGTLCTLIDGAMLI